MSRISLRVFWILLFPVATYASYIFLTETNAGCAVGDTNCVMLSGLAWMLAVVIAGILTAVQFVLLVADLFFRATEKRQ